MHAPPDGHERRHAHSARWPRLRCRRWVGATPSHRGSPAHLRPDRCRAHGRHLRRDVGCRIIEWKLAGREQGEDAAVRLPGRCRPHRRRTRVGQRTSWATRPRRSPSGTTSTAGSRLRTTAPRRSGSLLGLSLPTIPQTGPESPQALRTAREPSSHYAPAYGPFFAFWRSLRARQRGGRKLKVRPKCALSPDFRSQHQHPDSHHRRSEPVFVSNATHSTWCVIGNSAKPRSDSSRYPSDLKVARSRARAAGSQAT